MKISRFSIHRPVLTMMVMLIVIILGGVSLMRLPIDLMPDITNPTLSVRTNYENASPEEMEELITRPIEEALSAVPGVEEVSSVSSEGTSNVRVTFTWGTDLSEAADDMRDRIERVLGRLPEDADRPTLFKFDMASFPILILGASSNLDPVQVREMIDDQIKYRLERVPGVAALDVWGGLQREVHVDLHANKVKALELSLDQVMAAIRDANVTLPAGTIDRGKYEVTIRVPGEYTNLDELRNTVITFRGDEPIHLKDVANVEESWQKVRQIVRVNGMPGIRLAVRKQSGTNTVSVAKLALKEIERINRDIPQIQIVPIIDTSEYIQQSISNVSRSALYGGGLAILVLLFFLRNIRSTIVIATAIPISIIASFALMYFNGYTLNIMTLGGLALGVGMLLDNSIVVLENIYRLRESGLSRMDAAVQGSEEVTTAIVASTLTTLAVFLPMIFMQGMAGLMFKQFAMVIGFSLLCSLAVAVTLVPTLSARILKSPVEADPARPRLGRALYNVLSGFFAALENTYKSILHFALRHRLLIVSGGALALAGSVLLVRLVGVELMPTTDEGQVRVSAEMEVGTRLGFFGERLLKIEKTVRDSVPEAKSMVVSAGGSSWHGSGTYTGEIRVALVPMDQRTRSSDDVADDLRAKLTNIPGVVVRVRSGQGLMTRIFQRTMSGSGDKIAVEVRGHDLETADALAQRVKTVMEAVEGITDVRVSRDSGTPEETIV
ncbi:MAG: efflux RND transporter permease subunit, partial [Planctomycetes bacterium]|nr:efflux RND transporter permease subunit [Planctomycetota bacterium]